MYFDSAHGGGSLILTVFLAVAVGLKSLYLTHEENGTEAALVELGSSCRPISASNRIWGNEVGMYYVPASLRDRVRGDAHYGL